MTDKILIDRAVLEQAIAAIYGLLTFNTTPDEYAEGRKAKESLRAVLEQPQVEQEPVAQVVPCYTPSGKRVALNTVYQDLPIGTKLYTHQQPPRHPLTDEQINLIDDSTHFHESPDWSLRFARAIERAHGIGGEK